MDSEIPSPLALILAGCTLLTTGAFLVEKIPRLIAYMRAPSPPGVSRSTRDYWIGSVLALLCAGAWAASYASLDLVEANATPLQINVYLLGFAALFLYIASVIQARREGAQPADLIVPWQSGRAQLLVVANIGNFFLSVLALSYISASEALAINNFSPLILAAALWWRGKLRPSIGTLLALAMVGLGVFIINLDAGFNPRVGENLTGLFVALGAGVSFAFWTFTMSEVEERVTGAAARLRTLALVFFASYVVMITLGYLGDGNPNLSPRDLLILLFNGIRVAVVYLFLQYAIRLAGPLLTSIILVSMVPMTFPLDHLWNHTVISLQLMLGAALIVLAAIGLLGDELRRSAEPAA